MDSVGVFSLCSMGFPFGYISKTHVRVGMYIEEIAGCMACWFADILPYAVEYCLFIWILICQHDLNFHAYDIHMHTYVYIQYNIHYNKCIYIYIEREREKYSNKSCTHHHWDHLPLQNSEHLSNENPAFRRQTSCASPEGCWYPQMKGNPKNASKAYFLSRLCQLIFWRYVLFRGISVVCIYIYTVYVFIYIYVDRTADIFLRSASKVSHTTPSLVLRMFFCVFLW